MRRISLISALTVSFLILTSFYPMITLTSHGETSRENFSQTNENYEIYFREGGILSRLPPEKKNESMLIDGEFFIKNVTRINNTLNFDLYFRAPLFNLSALLDFFLSALSTFSNITVEIPQKKGNKSIWDILQNLSLPYFNISNNKSKNESTIFGELSYNISIKFGEQLIANRTIYISRYGEDLSYLANMSFSNLTNYSILNLTSILTKAMFTKTIHKTFSIEDVNITGKDILYVDIVCQDEMLSGTSYLLDYLLSLNETDLQTFIEGNNTGAAKISSLKVKLLELIMKRIKNSVGFVYDSRKYPSHIQFYGSISGSERYGAVKYFLMDKRVGNKTLLILNDRGPEGNETAEKEISTNLETWTMDIPFSYPTRINGNVTLHTYLSTINPIAIYPLEISLYDKISNKTVKIASTIKKVYGILYLNNPLPISLTIENVSHTFEAGHRMSLGIKVVNRSAFGVELILVRPHIYFNSTQCPSYLEFITAPLDDIRVEFSHGIRASQEIKRVERATYNITITNNGETDDNLSLSLRLLGDLNEWPEGWYAYIYLPTGLEIADFDWDGSLNIPAKGNNEISIEIAPSPDTPNGAKVRMMFSARGYRGSDNIQGEINIKVGKPWISFVAVPENKELPVGESFNYTFRVRNTGDDVDDFLVNATSQHGWIDGKSNFVIENLYPGNESEIHIRIKVPSNLSSHLPLDDDLLVTIRSKTFPSKYFDNSGVTTTAVELSFIDKINEFIEGKVGGLKNIFGDQAGYIILSILLLIVVLIIVGIIYLITRKYAVLICLDRIKEISPGKEEKFEVTIKNPSNMRLNYRVFVDDESIPEGWKVEVPNKEITLDSGEERVVPIIVKATEDIKPDSWAELKVSVEPKEKSKVYIISLLAISKGAIADLKIEKVQHSPKRFKSGDTVTTKFLIRNDGVIKAKDVKISLYINGEEMNYADISEIPPGGYAEIEMPWIAFPGRNDLVISVEM